MEPCTSSLNMSPGFELGGLIMDEVLPVSRRYVEGPATGEGPADTCAYGVEYPDDWDERVEVFLRNRVSMIDR